MINVVSQKWYGKAKRPTDVYIGRPSLLGNPFASKPSKHATQSVSSDAGSRCSVSAMAQGAVSHQS
jgi:hypothetical protein